MIAESQTSDNSSLIRAVNDVQKEWRIAMNDLENINLLIVGRTSAGKSTLLNAFLREDVARTGIDKITRVVEPFIRGPLTVIDSPGDAIRYKDQIFNYIDNGFKSNNVNKFIHCIWYCINTNALYIDDEEIDFIKTIGKKSQSKSIPVIVILCQSFDEDRAQQMKENIESKKLKIKTIIPVLAKDYKLLKNPFPKGLDELKDETMKCIPESIHKTLISIQMVSIASKRKLAISVLVATSLAIGIIDYFDLCKMISKLLLPIEITSLMASINAIYNIYTPERVGLLAGVFIQFISSKIERLLKTGSTNVLRFLNLMSYANSGLLTLIIGGLYIFLVEKVIQLSLNNSPISKDECKRILEEML